MELSSFLWLSPRRVPPGALAPDATRVPAGTIRCAVCGGALCPGSRVALHVWRDGRPPGYAVAYIKEPLQVVVCAKCEAPLDITLAWQPLPDGTPRIVCTSGWKEAPPIQNFGFSGVGGE